MRAARFAPSFLEKRGVLEWGWLQVGSSHFDEIFSLSIGRTLKDVLTSTFSWLGQKNFEFGIHRRLESCVLFQKCANLFMLDHQSNFRSWSSDGHPVHWRKSYWEIDLQTHGAEEGQCGEHAWKNPEEPPKAAFPRSQRVIAKSGGLWIGGTR